MATVKTIETEVELLKREVADMKGIHVRLDSAIEKIAEVSSSLHTIMAVHEEKLIRQEEALGEQEKEFRARTGLCSCGQRESKKRPRRIIC